MTARRANQLRVKPPRLDEGATVVDGQLDEPQWRQSVLLTGFSQFSPQDGIAADDCVLFLWATAPMMPQALEVMAAWGFEYKSQAVWVKDKPGTGYWFRNQHELLLVGTRGKIPAPAEGDQFPSVIFAPVGEHSVKPVKSLEIVEKYYPTMPKIELNRRGPAREGWDAWGAEAE